MSDLTDKLNALKLPPLLVKLSPTLDDLNEELARIASAPYEDAEEYTPIWAVWFSVEDSPVMGNTVPLWIGTDIELAREYLQNHFDVFVPENGFGYIAKHEPNSANGETHEQYAVVNGMLYSQTW